MGAGTINYISARNRVNEVGPLLAQQLDFLHEQSALDFSRLILAGHSLGGKLIFILSFEMILSMQIID